MLLGVEAFDYVRAANADTGDYSSDTGSIFSKIGHAVSHAAQSVEHAVTHNPIEHALTHNPLAYAARDVEQVAQRGLKLVTNNPIWDLAKTGIAFIPGIGDAVSAGMASAAAFGRGESLRDIGLAAARGALPGAAQVGLDVALGAVRKFHLGADALRLLRSKLPGGELAKGAFDAAIALHTHAGPAAVAAIRATLAGPALRAFEAAVNAAPAELGEVVDVTEAPEAPIDMTESAPIDSDSYAISDNADHPVAAPPAYTGAIGSPPPTPPFIERGSVIGHGFDDPNRFRHERGWWNLRHRRVTLPRMPFRRGSQMNRIPIPVRPPNMGRPFPQLGPEPNRVASVLLRNPEMRSLTARTIAEQNNATRRDAQLGMAGILNRFGARYGGAALDHRNVGDFESLDTAARRHRIRLPADLCAWPDQSMELNTFQVPTFAVSRPMLHHLYNRGDNRMRRGLLAHEMFAHAVRNTGELNGTEWTIRSGDYPTKVAKAVVGDPNRWREITAVNPTMTIYTDSNGATQLRGWTVGRTIQLPPGWFPSSVPATPSAAAAPSSMPGGPPFPAPSQYPDGYPSAVYTVKAGDNGSKIAARITGDPDRWRELLTTNPSKADPKYGIAVYPGNGLRLPLSWVAAQPSSIVMAQTQPLPDQGPIVTGSTQQLATIAMMLSQFYREHTDASYAGGVAFGTESSDLDGTWSPRMRAGLLGFQNWWNGRGKTPLQADGLPDDATVTALQRQTVADAATVGTVIPPLPAAVPASAPTPATSLAPMPPANPTAPSPKVATGGGSSLAPLLAIAAPFALAALA